MVRNIDLRSDTVTLQPEEMKDAMRNAEVGDEYYDDDPTIIKLQELGAEMLGKEAGLFVASGTMGNLVAILSQTNRGDVVIEEADSHSFRCEVSNFAVAGGVVSKQIKGHLGAMDPADIEAAIPAKGYAYAIASLLLIENTHNGAGGTCITPKQMAEYRKIADKYELNIHVDGARIFNAAVALGVKPSELAKDADTLSFCLSKGLACPFGGVLVGSKEILSRVRKYKQMVGGGFRQAGYMAACGIYALNNMVDRLAEDHKNAKLLANGLAELGMDVEMESVQTNMAYFNVPPSLIDANEFSEKINIYGGIKMNPPKKNRIRLVTHYGIEKEDVEYFLNAVKEII
jgi:threonine aldolase